MIFAPRSRTHCNPRTVFTHAREASLRPFRGYSFWRFPDLPSHPLRKDELAPWAAVGRIDVGHGRKRVRKMFGVRVRVCGDCETKAGVLGILEIGVVVEGEEGRGRVEKGERKEEEGEGREKEGGNMTKAERRRVKRARRIVKEGWYSIKGL